MYWRYVSHLTLLRIKTDAVAISVVDTFGAMYFDDLEVGMNVDLSSPCCTA